MSNSDISSTNSFKMGQEDEDASKLGDSEDNRSRNDSTQRLIDSLAKHKSKSNSRSKSKKHSSRKRSSRTGQDGDDISRLGDSEDNRSRPGINQRLQNNLAKHRSKSDSRNPKSHSRKSSSRKSSKHQKNRDSSKSHARKSMFSTPNLSRSSPNTKSRNAFPRYPSTDISENNRNSESDISHGF